MQILSLSFVIEDIKPAALTVFSWQLPQEP